MLFRKAFASWMALSEMPDMNLTSLFPVSFWLFAQNMHKGAFLIDFSDFFMVFSVWAKSYFVFIWYQILSMAGDMFISFTKDEWEAGRRQGSKAVQLCEWLILQVCWQLQNKHSIIQRKHYSGTEWNTPLLCKVPVWIRMKHVSTFWISQSCNSNSQTPGK